MKIYYQWVPGAYSNITALNFAQKINVNENDIYWLLTFKDVFEEIVKWNLWVIPIENSYAWSVHENFFHLSHYNVSILWEFYLSINHCLMSKSNDIKSIKKVYSHYQALMQCENYINNHGWKAEEFGDTAWSAKFLYETWDDSMAAVASELAAKIYNLNILDKSIQDQNWNTTRFFLVGTKWIDYSNLMLDKTNKISLLFKVKNIPAALYKCLWAFSTRAINLTRIESLPARDNPFEYMFWLDFETTVDKYLIDQALEELNFFWKDIKILGSY